MDLNMDHMERGDLKMNYRKSELPSNLFFVFGGVNY